MNALSDFLEETAAPAAPPRVSTIRQPAPRRVDPPPRAPLYDEQVRALVYQLFFQHESRPVRHVGFAAVEAATTTASLCLEVARVLADEERYDVGLIDAHTDPVPLQTQLQIPPPRRAESNWPIGPHLWMVPRHSWLGPQSQRISDQNLSRLRELTSEFDFSILWCAPVSWLTASIGQTCDGLVLVLTANKTRRHVVQIERVRAERVAEGSRTEAEVENRLIVELAARTEVNNIVIATASARGTVEAEQGVLGLGGGDASESQRSQQNCFV